jgi:hypothetical protein
MTDSTHLDNKRFAGDENLHAVALKDLTRFKAFQVNPELETIVWDNGADLAPEFLHSRLYVTVQSNDPMEQH